MGETKYPRQIEKGFIPIRYKAFFSLSIKLFHITEYFIGRFVPTHRAALFARFWNNAYIQNRFVASKRFRYFKLIFNPTLVRISIRSAKYHTPASCPSTQTLAHCLVKLPDRCIDAILLHDYSIILLHETNSLR